MNRQVALSLGLIFAIAALIAGMVYLIWQPNNDQDHFIVPRLKMETRAVIPPKRTRSSMKLVRKRGPIKGQAVKPCKIKSLRTIRICEEDGTSIPLCPLSLWLKGEPVGRKVKADVQGTYKLPLFEKAIVGVTAYPAGFQITSIALNENSPKTVVLAVKKADWLDVELLNSYKITQNFKGDLWLYIRYKYIDDGEICLDRWNEYTYQDCLKWNPTLIVTGGHDRRLVIRRLQLLGIGGRVKVIAKDTVHGIREVLAVKDFKQNQQSLTIDLGKSPGVGICRLSGTVSMPVEWSGTVDIKCYAMKDYRGVAYCSFVKRPGIVNNTFSLNNLTKETYCIELEVEKRGVFVFQGISVDKILNHVNFNIGETGSIHLSISIGAGCGLKFFDPWMDIYGTDNLNQPSVRSVSSSDVIAPDLSPGVYSVQAMAKKSKDHPYNLYSFPSNVRVERGKTSFCYQALSQGGNVRFVLRSACRVAGKGLRLELFKISTGDHVKILVPPPVRKSFCLSLPFGRYRAVINGKSMSFVHSNSSTTVQFKN